MAKNIIDKIMILLYVYVSLIIFWLLIILGYSAYVIISINKWRVLWLK